MNGSHFSGYALITGGVGFIGTNLAERLVRQGQSVVLLDDFSRPGVEANARFISELAPNRVAIVRDDCRNADRVMELVRGANQVFHLAAQVAVTTSLLEPERDFDVNARGTLNVLEAVRKSERRPPLVFTSTNKVYGQLAALELKASARRYEPVDPAVARAGIDERFALDFHSPYGCSKGAADQYVLDYARCYGLRSTVFRMSCIYGPHQCGNEDQGWVAHFLIRALSRSRITIYGDGLQVRDVLYVGDLVDALILARERIDDLSGEAFNVGGGPANAISLLEMMQQIAELTGAHPDLLFAPARNGDQRYFVTNTNRLSRFTGWEPKTPVQQGLRQLFAWLTRAGGFPLRDRDLSNEVGRGATLQPNSIEMP